MEYRRRRRNYCRRTIHASSLDQKRIAEQQPTTTLETPAMVDSCSFTFRQRLALGHSAPCPALSRHPRPHISSQFPKIFRDDLKSLIDRLPSICCQRFFGQSSARVVTVIARIVACRAHSPVPL